MANKVKTEEQPAAQLLRMDNVAIVVQDLDAAIQFFAELGLVLEGRMQVEGDWVDRVVGLTGVRSEIAMMRTPDGHSRLELTKYHAPAAVTVQTKNPPANTLGLHRIMFAVEDIDGVLARLRKHGAELFGEVAQYEQMYRLCYLRGPRASLSHWHSGLGETVTLSFPRKRFLDDGVAHDTTMQAPTRVSGRAVHETPPRALVVGSKICERSRSQKIDASQNQAKWRRYHFPRLQY